ncbi:enterotoxin A family protein [Candidatus Arsenophonus nilaparvatae]|uniref:enterotoxin A family protein n=1 Tax=Candidatus Arsenophonus nilaparvatae TaxID=1247023 RepID=UPI00068AFA62|nr:enterotoxin A family protein [Candidatus Arsenophonus nilaparvatae]
MKGYCILLCLLVFSHCSLADNSEKVYRAAMESPEDVKRAGGFYPRGMDGTRPNQPPPNINLWDHVHGADTGMARHDSGYVSSTTARGFAINWVNDHLNHNGYVYHIRATPNFIDVNGTLRNYSPHAEELETAALGIIYWSQIIGWERVRGGVVGAFIANPDYRERLYSNLASSGPQPQLAGFPDGHPAWGIQPWFPFANCELKTAPMSSCYPKKTAQGYGEAMFWDSFRQKIAKWFAVI